MGKNKNKGPFVAAISTTAQIAAASTLLSFFVYLLTISWLYIGGLADTFSAGAPNLNPFLPVAYSTQGANHMYSVTLLSTNAVMVLSALCLPVIRGSGWAIVAFWATMVCAVIGIFFALAAYKVFLLAGLCYLGSSLLFLRAYRRDQRSKDPRKSNTGD